MGAWFSSESDGDNYVPNTPSTRAAAARRNAARAVAPRVNNAGNNVEAASPVNAANGAAAPRLNNAGNNAEAPAPAGNGAAAPRVNNTTRNAERGNRRNNSRRNNAAAPKLNEPSPAGQEEEGFAPNTVVNVKNQAGGRKGRKGKGRKGKGRKGKSRKNRK